MKLRTTVAAVVFAISASCLMLPCAAWAEGNAGTANDIIYYEADSDIDMHFAPLDKETKTVKLAYAHLKSDSKATPDNKIDFVIPSAITVDGESYTVTAVGYDAKYATTENSDKGGGNTDLTDAVQTKDGTSDADCFKSVEIPETVNTLGSSCFGGWGIEGISFTGTPTVDKFGYGLFRACKNLKSINIPASVTEIGGVMTGPFVGSGLTSVLIPKTVKVISGDNTFQNCADLKQFEIEDGSQVQTLPADAFNGCSALESFTVGANSALTSIPDGTDATKGFRSCPELKTVDFGEGNRISVGVRSFISRTKLEEVKNAESVSAVNDYAFQGCAALKSISFDGCLESVGYRSFYNCSKLEDVLLGTRCSSIGNMAFGNCGSLTNIVIAYSGEELTFDTCAFLGGAQSGSQMATMYFYGNVEKINHTTSFFGNPYFLFNKLDVYGRTAAVADLFNEGIQSSPRTRDTTVNEDAISAITYHQLPSFSDPDVSIQALAPAEYIGEPLTPNIDITVGDGEAAKALVEGEDFQLVYSNNTEIGTAGVEIQGIGETYAYDSRKVTFEIIEPAAVTDALAKIAAVGEVTSLEQQAAVEAARAAYDAITNDAQKALIGDEQVNALKAAETQVKILGLEKQIADANDATVVGSLANQLAAAQAELDTVQTELGKTKADAEAAAAAAKADLDAAQAKISSAKTDQKLKVAKAQKTKTVKAKKAKKKAVKTSKVKVSSAKTKLTYAKVSGSEKLSISTSGKIKVKKGTKKGTYKIKVLVVAKSSAKYNAAITTVTIKVKVK